MGDTIRGLGGVLIARVTSCFERPKACPKEGNSRGSPGGFSHGENQGQLSKQALRNPPGAYYTGP